ncbi:MAG: DUF2339 domain-containing protein, partial [Actinobacteria bacterium]|nr:DUF2339 domain-containing protein [Actinomycetota bacterium]
AVATWFARIGALALLLAAAYGYKYAVDRGLVTPAMRVALGIFAGVSELAPGLSGEASIDVSEAVTAERVGSGAVPVLGYVALLDVGILAMVTIRPAWRVVGRVAFAGTWIFAALSAEAAGPTWAMAYGALFWAMFSAHPMVRTRGGRTRTQPEEAAFAIANAFAFWFFGMSILMAHAEEMRGAFTAAMGAGYVLQWATLRGRDDDRSLEITLAALAAGFFTLAVPIQFEGHVIAAGWTVEAVVLVALGAAAKSKTMRLLGAGLLALAVGSSVVVSFALGTTYDPLRPVVSGESLTLLLQVASLHAVAALLRRSDSEDEHAVRVSASVGAHVLALTWAAFEAGAYWYQRRTGLAAEAAIQFTLTVTWSLYAAGLMIAGVTTRRRRARLVALLLLVLTISKVVVIDLWLLTTLQRVLAFGALGAILLMCSLMYHQFRELILASDGR